VIPGLQSPHAVNDSAKGGKIAGVAQLEEHVATVTGHGTPDVRMQHAHSQRAVSSKIQLNEERWLMNCPIAQQLPPLLRQRLLNAA